jgi:hypothetical protein
MKNQYKLKKKNLTIRDFTPVIDWYQLETRLGKREYKRLQKWLLGQTVAHGGIYIDDLDRFLRKLPVVD